MMNQFTIDKYSKIKIKSYKDENFNLTNLSKI